MCNVFQDGFIGSERVVSLHTYAGYDKAHTHWHTHALQHSARIGIYIYNLCSNVTNLNSSMLGEFIKSRVKLTSLRKANVYNVIHV